MQYLPLVSIIIPVYNGSNFLAEAIESALAQTYQNIEILVINDGSTDDGKSEQIAMSYGNKINYFFKENGGVSSVLNFAYEKMNGEWFSWLSHDDLYKPEKIEKQIGYINSLIEENPNIMFKKFTVRTSTESIDKYGNIIKKPDYSNVPEHEKPIDTILNNVFNYRLSGCSFLLPRRCFEDIGGFREDVRTVSDVEYWYRLLFNGYEFYCLKDARLVQNRSHGQQVGRKKQQLFEQELNALHMEIADNLIAFDNENLDGTLIRYYKGLSFRHMYQAKSYVKKEYLKQYLNKRQYYVVVPVECALISLLGSLRNLLKAIYRKIIVK